MILGIEGQKSLAQRNRDLELQNSEKNLVNQKRIKIPENRKKKLKDKVLLRCQ